MYCRAKNPFISAVSCTLRSSEGILNTARISLKIQNADINSYHQPLCPQEADRKTCSEYTNMGLLG
jgi:hypothetical protein